MPISLSQGKGEKYVRNSESLLIACLRQKQNNSGNSHIVGTDRAIVSP